MSESPGWYPDPRENSDAFRWWDGEAWTRWLADAADALPPGGADRAEELIDPAPAPPTVRLPVAAVVTIAALVLALLAVGATVTATSQTVVNGPPLPPPTMTATPTVSYDSGTRTASAGPLAFVLPTAPWDCNTTVRRIKMYYSQAVACSAVVKEKYNGKADSYANVVIGLVEPDLTTTAPAATADRVFRQLQTEFFQTTTTVSNRVSEPAGIGPADQVWRVRARLNYRVPKLSSRYDTVEVVVADLGDGRFAGMISNLPDDAAAEIVGPHEAAIKSLSYR